MKTLTNFLENISVYDYEELEDHYETVLDSCHEPVNLAGMTIHASDMRNIDPIMFRQQVLDFIDQYYVEHDDCYYEVADFNDANEDFEEHEYKINEINDICDSYEFEILGWGLAPNPNGYSFEFVGEGERDQDAEERLTELLDDCERGDLV